MGFGVIAGAQPGAGQLHGAVDRTRHALRGARQSGGRPLEQELPRGPLTDPGVARRLQPAQRQPDSRPQSTLWSELAAADEHPAWTPFQVRRAARLLMQSSLYGTPDGPSAVAKATARPRRSPKSEGG